MGFEIINKLKKEKGLTNAQLASMAGITLSTLDKITAGINTNPKLETLQAICRALGCRLDDFDDEPIATSPDLVNVAGLSDRDKHEINELIKIKLGANETEPKVVDIKRSPRIRLAGKGGDPVSISITEEHSKKIKEAFEENNK